MNAEFDFIDWIRSRQPKTPRVPVPAGDDLAVLNVDGEKTILVGADQVLDGVHFDSKVHSPERIGRKAMNRNLSDCAAMACWPLAATVTFALPRGLSSDDVKQLYLGIEAAGAVFDCPIVGGDTGSWDGPLAISVAILGSKSAHFSSGNLQVSSGICNVNRNALRVGDHLYVTGPLGGSILGRHLDFLPRVREAQKIIASGEVSGLIDLSDGLSRDVGHLCRESKVGVELFAEMIPVHADVARMEDGRSPIDHALNDGEDYELLFGASHRYAGPGVRIGRVVAERGVWLMEKGERKPVVPRGWEHRW